MMATPVAITTQTTPVGLVKKSNRFCALISQKDVQSSPSYDPMGRESTIMPIQPEPHRDLYGCAKYRPSPGNRHDPYGLRACGPP